METKILHSEEGYRLQVGDQVSEESEYGQPVELSAGGKAYVAFVDVDDDGDPCTPLDSLVYCGVPVNCEEVEAAEGGEAEDTDADDEEDAEETEEDAAEV